MRWTWDERKNRENQRKHRISFETAIQVFDDPLAVTDDDPYQSESRFQTTGMVGTVVIMVVHTSPESESEGEVGVGRIISARKVNPRKRRIYEEY